MAKSTKVRRLSWPIQEAAVAEVLAFTNDPLGSFPDLGDFPTDKLVGVALLSDFLNWYEIKRNETARVLLEEEIASTIRMEFDPLLFYAKEKTDMGPLISPQDYAGEVITLLRFACIYWGAGLPAETMRAVMKLAARMKEAVMNTDFTTGQKVRAGGRKGHAQHHGAEATKEAKRRAYLAAFDQERAAGTGITEAYGVVAKKFGVSSKTIQRAVKRRKPQS